MSGCPPVLLGFLLLFSFAKCQSLASLQINYHKNYTVYFDDKYFQRFHECLCGANIRKCTITSDRKEDLWTWYGVTNIERARDTTNYPTKYFRSYLCTSYKHVLTTSIFCHRISNIFKKDLPDPYTSCQNIPVNTLLVSCSSGCFDIVWEDAQNITNIGKDTGILDCGACQTKTSTATSDKNIGLPVVIGVIMAVIVVLVIAGIIIVIWWRRKRNSKPPSNSHHYTILERTVSHHYEEPDEIRRYVNVHGPPVPNTYATANNESLKARRPGLQSGQDMTDTFVSAEGAFQTKQTPAARYSNTGNQGTEYSDIDENPTYTVPYNGHYNTYNNNEGSPVSSSTTPVLTKYARLGEAVSVRNIQNPYDDLQSPGDHSVAKGTPANSQTSSQYSLAESEASLSSTQDSETVQNSTPSSQPTNINAYEEVGVNNNNMTTRPGVSVNHYEETPSETSGDNKYGNEAPKEPAYTNFSEQSDSVKNYYANLDDTVRNIQNPLYNVTENQEENGPEESKSQAPPISAYNPYSLARPI